MGEGEVGEVQERAGAADGGAGEEAVEEVGGEVEIHRGGVFLGDGADEDAGAEEELRVDRQRLRVVRIQEPQRVDARRAVVALLLQGRVEVIEELVARFDGDVGGLGDGGPAVELMADDVAGGVVAVEGVEGAEHGPAGAEGLGGVAGVAADVGADDGDLEDGGEGDDLRDGGAVVVPGGGVVAEPVADFGARAGERTWWGR